MVEPDQQLGVKSCWKRECVCDPTSIENPIVELLILHRPGNRVPKHPRSDVLQALPSPLAEALRRLPEVIELILGAGKGLPLL